MVVSPFDRRDRHCVSTRNTSAPRIDVKILLTLSGNPRRNQAPLPHCIASAGNHLVKIDIHGRLRESYRQRASQFHRQRGAGAPLSAQADRISKGHYRHTLENQTQGILWIFSGPAGDAVVGLGSGSSMK